MDASRGRRSRWGALLVGWLAAALLGLTGCNEQPREQIVVQVGPEETIRFEPKSGFAHYYELPGRDDLLRIVLASYPLGCEDYSAPSVGEVFVTVSVRVPAPKTITPGSYAWRGLDLDEQGEEPREKADDENIDAAAEPFALPFVRLAEDARALPPGGTLELSKFEPETFGLVEGELSFRDAAEGQAAKTALLGAFSVRLCHLDLDMARGAPKTTQ